MQVLGPISGEAVLLQSQISKPKRTDRCVLDANRLWSTKRYPALCGMSKCFLCMCDDINTGWMLTYAVLLVLSVSGKLGARERDE